MIEIKLQHSYDSSEAKIMKVQIFITVLISVARILLAEEQENIYTSLLQQYVHSGKVQYSKLCKDPRLEKYISILKSTNPEDFKDSKERLAFWINAYNAYTLKVICDHYPIKSINDLHSGGLVVGSIFKTTIWDKDFVYINHKAMTLNEIEHKIIRPVFKDPRAHFALVCASKSCPPLRAEAFGGSKLDSQLNDQARIFLSDFYRNRFDVKERKAYLCKIFDWYGKDFGKSKQEILLYVTPFLPTEIAQAIRSSPEEWDVEFLDYDWTLNE
jgi:Protein of unknown function, DUF547